MVGFSIALPVECDGISGSDVPLVYEDASTLSLTFTSWDVGGAPCDADGREDPGDEHVAVGDAAGGEHVVADGAGVPSSVLGAILFVGPSRVADFSFCDADDVRSCCHYLSPTRGTL